MVLERRARAVGASLGAAGLAWLLWSGCGKNGATRTDAGARNDAQGGAGADARGAGGRPADAAQEPGSDAPAGDGSAAACPGLPGWYASPNVPSGCYDTCIPDNVGARVPALKWDRRDDWCPGCQWLEPSWWPGAQPNNASPLFPSVQALGPGPDLLMLVMNLPDKSDLIAMYNSAGIPVLAVAANDAGCSFAAFALGQDNETVGARYEIPRTKQRWVLRPKEKAGELMLATQPDFTYDTALIGNNALNTGSWFTARWIVDQFPAFTTLADVQKGTAVKINSLPGAPPGEYDKAVISGDAVFVECFTDKSAWLVVQNGTIAPFLGGPNVAIDRFATDGKWIVWNEGTNLITDPADPSRKIARRYDLYRSPFTTDPSKIQRQLLVPNTQQFAGISTFANGYFTDVVFSRPDASSGVHSQAFVVQVSTGQAWVSDLPQNYAWGVQNYPTATELWGAVSPNRYVPGYAYTVARVPYADMQRIQAALP